MPTLKRLGRREPAWAQRRGGVDVLAGGGGNDIIDGGLGGDVLMGGAGTIRSRAASATIISTVVRSAVR